MNNSDADNKQCKDNLKIYFDCVNLADKYNRSTCDKIYKLFNQCVVKDYFANIKANAEANSTKKWSNKNKY
jgi:hypothetical protein